jgi:hypothetical protein
MLTCPAVHIPTRSLLRSSSTPEPSDPLHSVVTHSSLFVRHSLMTPFRCRFCAATATAHDYQHGECLGSSRQSFLSDDRPSGGRAIDRSPDPPADPEVSRSVGRTIGPHGQLRGQTGPRPRESNVEESADACADPGRRIREVRATMDNRPALPRPVPAAAKSAWWARRSGRRAGRWRRALFRRLSTTTPHRPMGKRVGGGGRGRARPRSSANDPTAGSPTVTLLRLLLPLNAQVWKSSRASGGGRPRERPAPRGPVQMPH